MNEQLKQAITLMQQGKEEGFNAVYSATYNHVYFRAKQTMKHEQDAEDLVQTVYTEAYRSISSLQSPDALFGWLDTITYNQGMKMFRKKKDVLLTEESEGMFEELESNDISSMPEPTMDEKETGNIIKELIGELPEAQKASVTAYYFDGFSVGKIAEMMECTEGTVKSRLNYARKYLKERILQKEKKEGYALHAVGLPVLWYALWKLSQQTRMTAYAAETVYKNSCSKLGLATTALQAAPALAEAGAGTAQVMPAWASALADAGVATGTAAANSGATAGMQVSSVFNTNMTSNVAGAGADTAGAGVSTAATGAISAKVIIGAIAAAVVVFAGVAAIIPRLTNISQDDTQQARVDSSQDENENADTGDSTDNADADGTDADSAETGITDKSVVIDMAQYESDPEYRLSVNEEQFAETLNTYQAGLQEAHQLCQEADDTFFSGVDFDTGYSNWEDALKNETGIFSGFSEKHPYIERILMSFNALSRWNYNDSWRYCYYDLDGNGVDELIVAECFHQEASGGGTDHPIPESDIFDVRSIFSVVDGSIENMLNVSTASNNQFSSIWFGNNGEIIRVYSYPSPDPNLEDVVLGRADIYCYEIYQIDNEGKAEQIYSETRTGFTRLSGEMDWIEKNVLFDAGVLSTEETEWLISDGGGHMLALPEGLTSEYNARWVSIYPTDERGR